MYACPGCGDLIPAGMFLCLPCADRTPDQLIMQIGAALDAGDRTTAGAVLDEAVVILNGE